MTISSDTRKAGPFNGNGVTTSFPFAFKVFATSDVQVIYTDADEVETTLVLDSDYTVSLNADQDANPGGNVTYSLLATGEKLTVLGSIPYTQDTDIQNQGGFYPEIIEAALDKATMLIQQVKEKVDRAVVVPPSSSVTSEDYLGTLNDYKNEAATQASIASTKADEAATSADEAEADLAAIQDLVGLSGSTFNSLKGVGSLNLSTLLTVGMRVRTLGYNAAGDGGGNDYEIVAALTGTDDGGTYINLSGSGLQAKALFTNSFNAKQYGAVADGVISSTGALTGTDNILALRAFEEAAHLLGRERYIPEGSYLISAGILPTSTVRKNISIRGAGRSRTKLLYKATATSPLYNLLGGMDGGTSTAYYLTADAVKGSRVVTVNNAAALAVDSYLILKNNKQVLGFGLPDSVEFSPSSNAGQTVRVKSKSGNDVTLYDFLEYDYKGSQTATIAISVNAIVSITGHGLVAGDGIVFATTGALPTGITAGTQYYVIASALTADQFRFSTSYNGSAVNTSGSQSGVHVIAQSTINRYKTGSTFESGSFNAEGFTVVQDPNDIGSITVTDAVFSLQRFTRLNLDVGFESTIRYNISIANIFDFTIKNYTALKSPQNANFYGINIGGGCFNGRITHPYQEGGRHMITTTTSVGDVIPAHVKIISPSAINTHLASVDVHGAAARNFTITDVSYHASNEDIANGWKGGGVQLRGIDCSLDGFMITGGDIGINVAFANGNTVRNGTVQRCRVNMNLNNSYDEKFEKIRSVDPIEHHLTANAAVGTGGAPYPNNHWKDIDMIGDCSGAAVEVTDNFPDSWRFDNINIPDATVKWSGVPDSHSYKIITKTSDFTPVEGLECTYLMDSTSAAVVATPATAAAEKGNSYSLKKINAGGNACRFTPQPGDLINGLTSLKLRNGSAVTVVSDGVKWVSLNSQADFQVIKQASGDPIASLVGSVTETTLGTTPVLPVMGDGDMVVLTALLEVTSSANTKTIRVRLGDPSTGTAIKLINVTTNQTFAIDCPIYNYIDTGVSKQIAFASNNGAAGGASGAACVRATENTLIEQSLSITASMDAGAAGAGETVKLLAYSISYRRNPNA